MQALERSNILFGHNHIGLHSSLSAMLEPPWGISSATMTPQCLQTEPFPAFHSTEEGE